MPSEYLVDVWKEAIDRDSSDENKKKWSEHLGIRAWNDGLTEPEAQKLIEACNQTGYSVNEEDFWVAYNS